MTHQELIQRYFENDSLLITPLSGGDINSVYRIQATNETLVAKINSIEDFPNMLKLEADALKFLALNSSLKIPKGKLIDEVEAYQILLIEYINSGHATQQCWENFGRGLAQQHQVTATYFGWETDNYIGSLEQSNQRQTNWDQFLIEARLQPQIKLALDSGIISADECKNLEQFYHHINAIWPQESPALLHGDLWSGNFIVGENNEPYLIDPAVYFGHREMDIGMMHLFGGFDPELFAVYNNCNPLEKGWECRIKYNQLYPLLVHLNLFGRGYFNQIETIIRPFC